MKNLIHTAVVTLFAASAAHAQQAVQWRVEDGGNGHWYGLQLVAGGVTWHDASALSTTISGHLATCEDPVERNFINQTFAPESTVGGWFQQGNGTGSCPLFGPWIGGFQDTGAPDFAEPYGGWRWMTGAPFDPRDSFCCNNSCAGQNENCLQLYRGCGSDSISWNDLSDDSSSCGGRPTSYIVEWDADCNADGIIDYGQCHDGSLPDYNGNNIPDCCERGEACVVSDYPMQWTVADGGNGHFYQIREMGLISWSQSRATAQQLGGYLATLTTASESAFVARLRFTNRGVNLGGYQDRTSPDFSEPSGGWRWVTGEPWSYANWLAGEPNNAGTGEDFLMFAQTNFWGDKWADQDELCPRCEPHFFAVEWSADCNGDGIVDYGQILQGQLGDTNADGIPDICQQPTCVDADIYRDFNVNGADLGILLSQWGPNTPLTESDLNKDGVVNGADLGIMLSFWGACPN